MYQYCSLAEKSAYSATIRTHTCRILPTSANTDTFCCLCAGILAVEAYHAGSIRSFLCPQAGATTREPSIYTLNASAHHQLPRLSSNTHLFSACQWGSKAGCDASQVAWAAAPMLCSLPFMLHVVELQSLERLEALKQAASYVQNWQSLVHLKSYFKQVASLWVC